MSSISKQGSRVRVVAQRSAILPTLKGDPTQSMYMNEEVLVTGTLLGRFTCHTFKENDYGEENPPPTNSVCQPMKPKSNPCLRMSKDKHPPAIFITDVGRTDVVAAFSDDALFAVYAKPPHVYGLIGSQEVRKYFKDAPRVQTETFPLDRRMLKTTQLSVFHYDDKAILFSQNKTILVNLTEFTQRYTSFILPDGDVPCDYDGDSLVLFYSHQYEQLPCIRTRKMIWREEDTASQGRYQITQIVNQREIGSQGLLQLKFWNPDKIVLAQAGKPLVVFNMMSDDIIMTLRLPPKTDIIALNGRYQDRLVALSKTATMFIWDISGELVQTYDCWPAKFTLGLPYLIRMSGDRIVFSSDEGVYMVKNKLFAPL